MWYRMADLRPPKVPKDFVDESDLADASGLFAFPCGAAMEAILCSLAAVLAGFFV